MAPPEWTTPTQRVYLKKHLSAFLSASEKKGTSLTRFWASVNEGWFEQWPAETKIGVAPPPAAGEEDIRTKEQILAVGEATTATQNQLKNWMRNRRRALRSGNPALGVVVSTGGNGRGKRRSLFSKLQKKKATRPYRKIEIYQKLYAAKLKVELMRRGYGLLNEEAAAERVEPVEARIVGDAEVAAVQRRDQEATEVRLKEYRRKRMSLQRTVAMEMFASETPEVLEEVAKETDEWNEERVAGTPKDGEDRTPEEMQLSIDELGEVVKMVLEAMGVATGWQFLLLGGGPSPRNGGNIQAKTICFGTTPHGIDFRGSHPNFEEAVLTPFIKYLKRTFPHDVRDARVLGAEEEEEEEHAGLLVMDPDPEDTPVNATPHKPKRMRCKKPTGPPPAAALTGPAVIFPPAAPAATPALAPVPPLVPAETGYEAPVLSLPSFGLESAHGWSDNEGALPLGLSQISDIAQPEEVDFAEEGPAGTTTHDVRPCGIYRGAGFDVNRVVGGSPRRSEYRRSAYFDAFSKPPAASPLTSSLGSASAESTSFSVATFPPGINSTIKSVATYHFPPSLVVPGPLHGCAPPRRPVLPTQQERALWLAQLIASAPTPSPAPPPATSPIAPAPTLSPACGPTLPPARAPMAPAPTPSPARVPTSPPARPPTPSPACAPTPSSPPARAMPHYPVSRPMANAPKGHHLAAATVDTSAAAKVGVPTAKRKPGRPRKTHVAPAVGMDVGSVGNMTPEARAESDHIHREEAQLRETRKELLRRGKVVDDAGATMAAEEKRLAALLDNPAGGAPLTIVKRSSRAIKAMLDPEGNPLIHPVVRTRGDVGNGGRLALRVLGSAALRAQEDAEMLEKLSGKQAAGTKKTSAAKGGAKRKASDTIPVGGLAAKRAPPEELPEVGIGRHGDLTEPALRLRRPIVVRAGAAVK
ncbi:hypothetical protein K438DRAFT_1749544 [Mycena galopus ATCC 62051]|nr:hypothetical protein K438DRAFT_1749544 [Mycena galopus ATCC 62051]